jgi:hypothetical protein
MHERSRVGLWRRSRFGEHRFHGHAAAHLDGLDDHAFDLFLDGLDDDDDHAFDDEHHRRERLGRRGGGRRLELHHDHDHNDVLHHHAGHRLGWLRRLGLVRRIRRPGPGRRLQPVLPGAPRLVRLSARR